MAVGVGVAAGETTISTSTSTTTLTGTQTSAVVTASTTSAVETSGNTIRDIAAGLLTRTEGPQTDSVEQHEVIHWPIVKGPPVKNSIAERAISVAPTEEQQATVVELAVVMQLVIAAVHGIEVEGQVRLARAIDLAARAIVALEQAEIALGVETLEAVLGIEARLEMVPDTAAAVSAPTAVGVLPA